MRLTRRWSALVDARPLGTARIAIGLGALAKLVVIAPILLALASPGTVRLPWREGFAPALAAAWLPFAIIALWAAAALALAAGLRTRFAGSVLCGAAALVLLTDRQLYSNHLYLLIVLVALLVVADAGAARSLDAAGSPRSVRNLGPDLIRLQVTIVYIYAALWKINPVFLSGWMIGTSLTGGAVTLPASLRTPETLAWIAALTVAFEIFVPIALWTRSLRMLGATVGVLLHVAFVLFIALPGELIVFGILMIGCYPLFRAQGAGEG